MNDIVPVNTSPSEPTVWYAEVPRSINRLIVVVDIIINNKSGRNTTTIDASHATLTLLVV